MALNDVNLAGGMRVNLLNLQLVSALQARTTERLATGRRVNSPVDDAAAFFSAQNHRGRAADLAARKDAMGEALQTVRAASEGVKAITQLIEQAKGLAASARSADVTERAVLAAQFDELLNQIDQLSTDAGYRGTNFLASDTLTVEFNEDGSSSIDIVGFDASSTGLGIAASTGCADETRGARSARVLTRAPGAARRHPSSEPDVVAPPGCARAIVARASRRTKAASRPIGPPPDRRRWLAMLGMV